MDTLTKNVASATGLKADAARAAIIHVLLFLRDEMPEGHFGEFIDKIRQAREAVDAAAAAGLSRAPAALEGLASVMGHGGPDVSVLAGNLMSLGLDPSQVVGLMNEIISRAEEAIGATDAMKIKQMLPQLAAHFPQSAAAGPAGR